MLQFLIAAREANALAGMFEISEQPCGRIKEVTFEDQVQFEGFIWAAINITVNQQS